MAVERARNRDLEGAAALVRRVLAVDPVREPTYRLLMRGLPALRGEVGRGARGQTI